MTDTETIEQRLSAVERALTDGDAEFESLAVADDLEKRLTALEERLDDVESQLTELDAATQALRGYVGNVRSVNQEVERHAETALAKVEQLEAQHAERGGHDQQGHESEDRTGQRGRNPERGSHTRGTHRCERHERNREDQQERDAGPSTTCDACGQATGETRQRDESGSERDSDRNPAEWVRDAGTGREAGTDATARPDGGHGTDGNRGTGRRDANRQDERGRATGRRGEVDETRDEGGFLAGLRDAL